MTRYQFVKHCQSGGIAQLGEHLLCKQRVNGSIPFTSTITDNTCGGIAQLGEHLLCKQRVNGSIPFTSTITQYLWGYSSAGRASALQAEGQRFDPVYLHHHCNTCGGIAQLGEHLLCKQRVNGSIPFTSTI